MYSTLNVATYANSHYGFHYFKSNLNFLFKSLSFFVCDACFFWSGMFSLNVSKRSLSLDTYPSLETSWAHWMPSGSVGCMNPGRKFFILLNLIHPNCSFNSFGRHALTISSFVSKTWKWKVSAHNFLSKLKSLKQECLWFASKGYCTNNNFNQNSFAIHILIRTYHYLNCTCIGDVWLYC